MTLTVQRKEPIAIIGSGCRFPGQANTPSKLWQLLQQPRDVLSEIGPDRFNAKGFYHPDPLHHGNSNAKHAYLLSEDYRQFDARFFGIKGVEADAIDPQQRLLLEVVYEGIEAAGLQMENLCYSDTAVYVGQMCADYDAMLLRDLDSVPTYHATGNARSIMANRISYFFDWHGPSLTIDTACSSSLVALHHAVQSLRSGESHLAVAAGSNLILGPENYIVESKLKMLSPTGRSRMWDKDADGYARGEGVAAVVLKSLSAAIADGDHIECLIRETGVNQDGRTRGITMPSATAQTALIRDTYAKAGLDARKAADRCQYFEAHGTGTPTGDPLEAEAVTTAFFPDKPNHEQSQDDVLYIGSIKTIIGHTEGTAGLAGVLKASLALQNSVVPPNMLFNHLNPSIQPFYGNLQILSQSRAWPAISPGQPRRASVNSFGFGGTNAHAILESYEPVQVGSSPELDACLTPFTFSASTSSSLTAQLNAYAAYLADKPAVNLQDLRTSLQSRSLFPIKAAFAAQSHDDLESQIKQRAEKSPDVGVQSSSSESPAILGIFTGQGAQYAGMAADLILSSSSARSCIENLEKSLSALPMSDRPQWSLVKELLANASSSRVAEAAISQPLCTAVQILLVDILGEAGLRFHAVIGHSSGDIACAYAAGRISAHDAIRISYYRGLHSHLAIGKDEVKGAMLAVATSKEDAQEICELPEFEGRITVAAVNSAASVTLSGDEDAIAEAKIIFTDEKKKTTTLKVDKAYHSSHMTRCSDAYMQSMKYCDVKPQVTTDEDCSWYSSVYNEKISRCFEGLKAAYWNDNLVRPVLFAQALTTALEQNPSIELVVEVGPHPALKGPASMNIQDALSRDIPYTGLLNRRQKSVNALAEGLGYIWTHLGERSINLERVDVFLNGGSPGELLKDLPPYQWDHNRTYWQESRVSRALRTRQDPVHELLGSKLPVSTGVQMSFRNLLRMKEVPWITGHALQGQTVFPAAGYVATAIEASKHLVPFFREAQLIEIQDFVIHQPLVFNDDDLGIETLFSFIDIATDETNGTVSALFTYHSATSAESDGMTLMANGRLQLLIGAPSPVQLPTRAPAEPNMVEVEADRFYASLAEIGYAYTGPFRALSSLQRKLGRASGLLENPKADGRTEPLMIHPAMLDAGVQAVILAFCYPNDGQLWSLHLPTSISRIQINPRLGALIAGKGQQLQFDSCISESSQSGVIGDVSIYTEHEEHALLQLEGMRAVPFTGATSENDANVFSAMTWGPANLSGEAAVGPNRALPEEYTLASTLERVATFYLRVLDEAIPKSHPARQTGPYVGYFNYATHVITQVLEGRHPYAKQKWMTDSLETILETSKAFPESPDLKIMHIVGREMPRVIHGETTILEHLLPNGLLDSYYSNALGVPQCTTWLSRMTAQLTHRYPRMNVLEIGAGTGGATKGIFKECGQSFSSYAFTDISNGFFDTAKETFKDQIDRMVFKVLDVEKDITAQGFEDYSYDLIVASFVLHATAKLEQTMRNVRRLLKPGGHVLMAEVTNNDQSRVGFIFGALPGWWLGGEDGRALSPCVSPAEWDAILRKTGFSGADTVTHELDRFPYVGSIIASQAVDPRINFLRRPLSAPYPQDLGRRKREKLVVIGGTSLKTQLLAEEVSEILLAFYLQIERINSIAHISASHLTTSTTILCLSDLDKPVFKDISPRDFQGLKLLFSQECTMMWITEGRRASNPESNMIHGFARSQQWEVPGLNLQFLDLETPLARGAHLIAEGLVRWSQLVAWKKAGRLGNVVWSQEPEIVLRNDEYLVPRLAPYLEANDRLNSSKRQITKTLCGSDNELYLGKDMSLQPLALESLAPLDSDHIDLDVEYSTACSVMTLLGPGYVAIAKTVSNQTPVLAIFDSQATRVRVPKRRIIFRNDNIILDESRLLMLFAHHLFADYLISKVYPGETMLVHEANHLFATVLQRRANEVGVKLILTSGEDDDQISRVFIHPFATDKQIQKGLPKNVSVYVDMTTEPRSWDVGKRIASLLPHASMVEDSRALSTTEVRLLPDVLQDRSQELLEGTYVRAISDWEATRNLDCNQNIIDAIGLNSKGVAPQLFDQIRWSRPATIEIDVRPVDSTSLFSNDKTYWLVGLTGGLGLSLCEWMIRHGAKYVVISSRNPRIDDRWSRNMLAAGATVKIASCDATSRDSVRKLYREICGTLPPIAGVAQGAMVLQDVPTRDMSFQDLDRVLKPKVEGSKYLDELFQQNTLDFLVFFSSITGLIGNMGQSNYTAANSFMCALARQRREKGLAGSVINIGVIIGVGYVTREVSHADQRNLRKSGYMLMSERDFHQIFAESVLASRPDSGIDPEISTGLRRIALDDPYQPIWYNNPVFSKCILQKEAVVTQQSNNDSGPSMKVRLQAATTETQINSIVQDCFTVQLQTLLGGASEDVSARLAMLDSRTDELGIDSLIAVEIRSWFMKNMSVNVPVLKILTGTTVRELLQFALKMLPQELHPSVVDNTKDVLPPSDPVPSIEAVASQSDKQEPEMPSSKEPMMDQRSEISGSGSRNVSTPASSVMEGNLEEIPESRPAQAPLQRRLPMSSSQSMFWFVTVLLKDKTTLNHFGYSRLQGRLRVQDLERAVDVVVQRHEALRTCFFVDDYQQPTQGVLETSPICFEYRAVESETELQEECTRLKQHIYDLGSGETMRIVLLSKSAKEHYLLIGCHHINVDGISHQVLMSDILKAYNHESLPIPVLQYPDYSLLQRQTQSKGGWGRELTFWKQELADFKSVLPILSPSTVTSRRPLQEYRVHRVDARISAASALRIKDTCRRNRSTPFHFYLAVFKTLLFRFSHADDICIGIGEANRSEQSMLEAIGPFVNLLPLRFRLSGSQTFQEALQEARSRTYDAIRNSEIPFEVLLNELNVLRSASQSPLFQAFIDYRQGAREKMSFGECELEVVEFEAGRTAYDLSLDILDDAAGQPLLMMMAQTSLYSKHDAEILTQSYVNLVEAFTREPDVSIDQAPLYKTVDTELALEMGRGTYEPSVGASMLIILLGPSLEMQWPETLVHRIKQISDGNAAKTAIIDVDGKRVNYEGLSKRSDKIASALIAAGITPKSTVAVFQEPSSYWICSFLAILSIGAIYLPLDVGTPILRLAAMATEAQVCAILVHEATKEQATALMTGKTAVIDVSQPLSSHQESVPILAKRSDVAVVLYTSGSTGVPKGILISHESFAHEVEASADAYGLGPEVVILQQSALGFDMSVLQILLALTLGGTLCLSPRSARGDPVSITELIVRDKVSFTCATPTEYLHWMTYGNKQALQQSYWKAALSGGEVVSRHLLQCFNFLAKPDLRLFNGYGPTETTCCSTKTEIDYVKPDGLKSRVAIGFPSPNESVYIVDEKLLPVPVGVPGEILIGGVGVARGYLRDEELTKTHFVPNLFASAEYLKNGWTTMYRTGDKGRWHEDGSLSVEGRLVGDTQIKLRGLRIELREVEDAILLTSHGALSSCVVSARADRPDEPQFLVAHVVFDPKYPPSERDSHLRHLPSALPLPQYMCPALIIPLENLPVNGSGKIDRRSITTLPITRDLQANADSAASSSLMLQMKETWREVISNTVFDYYNVEAESDFFHVGGNSMLLVRLQALIRHNFQVSIPLTQLFAASTLRHMTLCVEDKSESLKPASIDWVAETEPDPALHQTRENLPGSPVATPPEVIIMTGATGFLGPYLMQTLTEDPRVRRVHCIAVRNAQSRETLFTNDKVIVHEGDLTLPLIGLSPETATKIFNEADAVIHNGADISHLKTYQTLRLANLSSTKEIVKLSLPRQLPIHYVSTASVAMFTPRTTFAELSVADTLPPTDGSEGYTASKWASERYLERIYASFSTPVSIHRPSSITRSSSLLGEDATEMELLQNLLKYSRLMKAVPNPEKLVGSLDFVTVENVANGIMDCVLNGVSRQGEGVEYVHQTGDFCLPLSDMRTFLENETNAVFEALEIGVWAERAESRGLHPAVAAAFKRVESMEGVMVFPDFLKRERQ